jgi:hypothetical protein
MTRRASGDDFIIRNRLRALVSMPLLYVAQYNTQPRHKALAIGDQEEVKVNKVLATEAGLGRGGRGRPVGSEPRPAFIRRRVGNQSRHPQSQAAVAWRGGVG